MWQTLNIFYKQMYGLMNIHFSDLKAKHFVTNQHPFDKPNIIWTLIDSRASSNFHLQAGIECKVYVEQSQDISAWIHQRWILIVSG